MQQTNEKNSRLVYSTETGGTCPVCKKKRNRCTCRQTNSSVREDGIVRVQRSTKGRKGKGVTLVTGVAADDGELKRIAKTLKQKCGSGGTVKSGTIEIQGDHREVLVAELGAMGYRVKLAGG